MKDIKVKVAIVGAGTSGLSALQEVKKRTDEFVIIDGGPLGTTCARVGCMPSKIFIQIANDYHRRFFFNKQGIENSNQLIINDEKMMKYLRSLRDYFVNGVIESIKQLGDKYIEGHARFIEPNVLDVEGIRIIADKIIVATGSSPIIPEEWQKFRNKIITTDTLFEEKKLSSSFGVVGAGIIGLELGQALGRLGIKVTIVEQKKFIGGLTDPLVNDYAINVIGGELNLFVGIPAKLSFEGDDLLLESNGKIDKVLLAIGRKPNYNKLGLEAIGIKLNEKNLISQINLDTLQVDKTNIYVAGDCNGYRPLLHEAADEGRIAGYNSVRESSQCFNRRTPLSITFTDPNIAIAGKLYNEIKDKPHIVGESLFEDQGRSRIKSVNKGIIRIYAEPHEGKILGSEMIAPDGEYIGHLLAWCIQNNLTATQIMNMPFYHPSIVEGIRAALRQLALKVNTSEKKFELPPCK